MKEHEHATRNTPDTEPPHDKVAKTAHAGPAHQAHMSEDFRKRFWISLVLTAPILVLSPMLQSLVGLGEAIGFSGDLYVLFGLSSAVFWYGGWPFLRGFVEEPTSARVPTHKTKGRISIHVLSGHVQVKASGRTFSLRPAGRGRPRFCESAHRSAMTRGCA